MLAPEIRFKGAKISCARTCCHDCRKSLTTRRVPGVDGLVCEAGKVICEKDHTRCDPDDGYSCGLFDHEGED